jgi:hypothetical protein
MRRLPRAGFLQQTVWPVFGLYPWECPICRRVRLIRYRGAKGRQRLTTNVPRQEGEIRRKNFPDLRASAGLFHGRDGQTKS